jgi:hypothetical protein
MTRLRLATYWHFTVTVKYQLSLFDFKSNQQSITISKLDPAKKIKF